jgi:ribose transport system substrate-binding protein
MLITRRTLLTSSAGGLAALSLSRNMAWAAELPKLKKKDVYKVGFAQTAARLHRRGRLGGQGGG